MTLDIESFTIQLRESLAPGRILYIERGQPALSNIDPVSSCAYWITCMHLIVLLPFGHDITHMVKVYVSIIHAVQDKEAPIFGA